MRTSKFVNPAFRRQVRVLERISAPFFAKLEKTEKVNAALLEVYKGLGLGSKFYSWDEWEKRGFKPKEDANPQFLWGGTGSNYVAETREVVFYKAVKSVYSNLQVQSIN